MTQTNPSFFLPGYDVTDDGILIPFSALPGLTPDEYSAYSGDIRKILYEIDKAVLNALNTLDAGSKPTKFNIARNTPTVINATTIRQIFTKTYDLDLSNADVATEPS